MVIASGYGIQPKKLWPIPGDFNDDVPIVKSTEENMRDLSKHGLDKILMGIGGDA